MEALSTKKAKVLFGWGCVCVWGGGGVIVPSLGRSLWLERNRWP